MRLSRKIHIESGFTLLELSIVITIAALFCGLLMSSLSKAKATSMGAACVSNLRQIGTAMNLYRLDHNDTYPKTWDSSTQMMWTQAITGGNKGTVYLDAKVLNCPSLRAVSGSIAYGMTSLSLWYPTLHRTDDDPTFFTQVLIKSAEWPLVMDADALVIYSLENPTAGSASTDRFTARHNGRANVLMADGHVEQPQYGDTRWSQKTLNDGSYY